jgi:hypothetical protein
VSIVIFYPEYSVIPSLSINRYSTGAGQKLRELPNIAYTVLEDMVYSA